MVEELFDFIFPLRPLFLDIFLPILFNCVKFRLLCVYFSLSIWVISWWLGIQKVEVVMLSVLRQTNQAGLLIVKLSNVH